MKRKLFLLFVLLCLIGVLLYTPKTESAEVLFSVPFSVEDAKIEIPSTFLVDGYPIADCRPTFAQVRLADGELDADEPITEENGKYTGKAEWRDLASGDVMTVYSDHYERWGIYYFDSVNMDLLPDTDRWGNPFVFHMTSQLDVFKMLNQGYFSEAFVYNKNGVIAEFTRVSDANPDENALRGWEEPAYDTFCKDPSVTFNWTEDRSTLKLVGMTDIQFPREFPLGRAWFYTGKTLSSEEIYSLKYQLSVLDQGTHWSGIGFVAQGTSSHGSYEAAIIKPESEDKEIKLSWSDVGVIEMVWQLPGMLNYEEWEKDPSIKQEYEYIPMGLSLPIDTEIFVYSEYRGWQRFILTDKTWNYLGHWQGFEPVMLEGENDEHPWQGFDTTPQTPVGCPPYTCDQ